jgi:plastocyanin
MILFHERWKNWNLMSSSTICKTNSSLLLSALFFVTALSFSPLGAVAATHDVTVGNNFFSPNDLTIEVGDTVRWTSNAGRNHDVTADDGSFAGPTASSFTFSRMFSSAEEVLYFCSVHSSAGRNRATSMNGRINVVEATVSTDVSVESIDALGSDHEAGEDFTVKTMLKNNGAGGSGMFNVSFYASTDNVITSGDTLLGTEVVSDISAGASKNIEESVDLPIGLASGDYFIGAIIDLDDNNLDNNVNVDETPIFVFKVFTMNAGLNDAWFNPVTDGQGFFITVFPVLNFVSLAWFTYDTELPPLDATANLGDPGHRWLTAGGLIDGEKSVMDIVLTSGGLFDASDEVTRTEPPGADGTITLKFDNCSSGTIEYDITSIDAQGTVPIRRVADDNTTLCIALLREAQPDL